MWVWVEREIESERERDQTKKKKKQKYFVNSLANLECDKRKIKYKWTKEREERTSVEKYERGEEIVECFALNFTFFSLSFHPHFFLPIKWSSSTTHTHRYTHITVLFRNRNKEKLENSLQYL